MDQNCVVHQYEPESAICINNQCKKKRLICFRCPDDHIQQGCSKEQHSTFNEAKNELDMLLKQMFSSNESLQAFCCIQQRVILEDMLIILEQAQKKIIYFENIIKNTQELNQYLINISLNEYKLRARLDDKTLSQYTQQYEAEPSNLIKKTKLDYFNIQEQEKIMQVHIQQDSPYYEDFSQISNQIKKKN